METQAASGAVAFTSSVTEWTETLLDETPKADIVEQQAQDFGILAPCQAKTFRVKCNHSGVVIDALNKHQSRCLSITVYL